MAEVLTSAARRRPDLHLAKSNQLDSFATHITVISCVNASWMQFRLDFDRSCMSYLESTKMVPRYAASVASPDQRTCEDSLRTGKIVH